MTSALIFARWSWPALSLAVGVLMGAMSSGGISPAAKDETTRSRVTSTLSTVSAPSPEPPLPAEIKRQFANPQALETDKALWLPATIVDAMYCSFGSLDEKCYISEELSKALSLTRDQKASMRAVVDRFLAEVRTIEVQNMQIRQKTATELIVHIPGSLNLSQPTQELEKALLPILGPDHLRIVRPRLKSQIGADVPSATGLPFTITVTLSEQGGIDFKTVSGAGSSGGNSLPSKYKHLVQIVTTDGHLHWR